MVGDAVENVQNESVSPEFAGHHVDAVTLALTLPPDIQVEAANFTILNDGSSTVDFGSTPLGTPVTRTFTVRNLGNTGALNLNGLTLPAGFDQVAISRPSPSRPAARTTLTCVSSRIP